MMSEFLLLLCAASAMSIIVVAAFFFASTRCPACGRRDSVLTNFGNHYCNYMCRHCRHNWYVER